MFVNILKAKRRRQRQGGRGWKMEKNKKKKERKWRRKRSGGKRKKEVAVVWEVSVSSEHISSKKILQLFHLLTLSTLLCPGLTALSFCHTT